MGVIWTKLQYAYELLPRFGVLRQPRLPNPERGGEIHLSNPNVSGEVSFDARLVDVAAQYVLKDVKENGLAYLAGLRDDDVLLELNSTSTKGMAIKSVLDLLRHETKLLLAVERSVGEDFATFTVKIEDGVPTQVLHQTIARPNNMNVLPAENLFPSTPTEFSYQHKSGPFDIFIDKKPPLYLTVKKNKSVFSATYNKQYSMFYKFIYAGGDPSEGVVVAFSTENNEPRSRNPILLTCPASPASISRLNVEALDFPESMLGKSIPLNQRFWYEKVSKNGVTLESLEAKGKYIGLGMDNEAVLSVNRTDLNIKITDVMDSESESSEDECGSLGAAAEAAPEV